MTIISLCALMSNIYTHVSKFMSISIRYEIAVKIIKTGLFTPAGKLKVTFYFLH